MCMFRKGLFALVLALTIAVLASCGGGADLNEAAERVAPGQTYEEVCDIIGRDGTAMGADGTVYEWHFADQGNLLVFFTRSGDQLVVSEFQVIQ